MDHLSRNKQSGVTLLISILVMAGVALISLAAGAFAIQEIRSSRAILLSEPAIGAAETAGEKGLWAIKRTATLADCTSGQTSTNLSNGALVNACKSYTSAIFNLIANTANVFYLYDPNNINGDIDLLAYPYNTLSVIHQSGAFSVSVTVVRLDGTAVDSRSVSPGSTLNINIPAVPAGSEGRMRVTLQSVGNAAVLVNTNQGLPKFPTVTASGCAAKTAVSDCNNTSQELFTRKINITVPQE